MTSQKFALFPTGQPDLFVNHIDLNTGIDFNTFFAASFDVSRNISELLNECQRITELVENGQNRMRELRRHIETTIRQCPKFDKQLCDTLETTNLNITFNVNTVNY